MKSHKFHALTFQKPRLLFKGDCILLLAQDDTMPKYLIRLFNRKEYFQKFVTVGQMYMNTLEFFRKQEEGFQGDPHEGKLIDRSEHAKLMFSTRNDFEHPDFVLADVEMVTNGYVYCFFAANENDIHVTKQGIYDNPSVNGNLRETITKYRNENSNNDIYIVVLDAKKTIEAIEQQLQSISFPWYQGYVQYVQTSSLSPQQLLNVQDKPWTSAFRKPQQYQYQSEWRVFIHTRPLDNHAEVYLKCLSASIVCCGRIEPATD